MAEIRSLRCSELRDRSIRVLDDLGGTAYPTFLAAKLQTDVQELHMMMIGFEMRYSFDLSPVALGWVVLVGTPHGDEFRLTERGRAVARAPSPRPKRIGGLPGATGVAAAVAASPAA